MGSSLQRSKSSRSLLSLLPFRLPTIGSYLSLLLLSLSFPSDPVLSFYTDLLPELFKSTSSFRGSWTTSRSISFDAIFEMLASLDLVSGFLPPWLPRDLFLTTIRSIFAAPPYRAVLETLYNSLVESISLFDPVRLSSLKDDDLLEWFTNKARTVERGFQKVLDKHRKAQEATEAALKENESRYVSSSFLRVESQLTLARPSPCRSNMMLVDLVVTSTPVKNSSGKRPRRPTDETKVQRAPRSEGGGEGAVESPLQKMRRLTGEAKANWGL